MNDEIKEDICKLAQGIPCDNINTAYFIESQGCLYLLSKMPSHKIRALIQLTANHTILKQRYSACAEVFDALCDIPYAVIKGAVLSDSIYLNPAYRISGDIDLLISPSNIEKIKEILIVHGFVQGFVEDDKIIPYTRNELIYQKVYTHQIASFVKETGNRVCPFVNIDINLDIMWGESSVHTDMDEFLKHTTPHEIFGIKVLKLEPVYEFISLCMHHYKDLNSLYLLAESGIKLSLFCDIYYYITNVSPDIAELKKISDSLGVTDYITFCLYHTNRIMESEKINEYLEVFRPDDALGILNRFGLAEDEYKYPDFVVSDCLFSTNFTEKFNALLTEKDRKKIEINRKYM